MNYLHICGIYYYILLKFNKYIYIYKPTKNNGKVKYFSSFVLLCEIWINCFKMSIIFKFNHYIQGIIRYGI